MPHFIAFLRAINVGGHNVKMADLRALFEALGFADVETFIASGNVIFKAQDTDAQALERQIEAQLRQALGYAVATFLRTPAELAAIVQHQSFPAQQLAIVGSSLYIAFLPDMPADAAVQKLLNLRTEIDSFHINGRELYWHCRTSLSESKITGAALERAIGMPATMRNVTTVRKLAAKYPAEQ